MIANIKFQFQCALSKVRFTEIRIIDLQMADLTF